MAKNKTLKVLSTGTVAGMIAAAVLSSQAFAAVDAYSVKIGEDVLKYDKAALTESFLAAKAGEAAPLYEDFTANLTKAGGFYAFSDAKTGKFVSYDDIQAKFLEAKAAGEAFVVDTYTESADAKVLEVPTVKKVVVKDGKVVVETDAQTSALKVESVSAINQRQIKIDFNTAPNATEAVKVANYLVGTVQPASAVVSGNSVVITMSHANVLANYSKNTVVVKKAVGLTADQTVTNVAVSDTSIPTVLKVEATGPRTLKVTFSEVMNETLNLLTGVSLDNGTVALDAATAVSYTNNTTVATIKTLSNLSEGDHTLAFAATNVLKDEAGYQLLPASVTFAYAKDSTPLSAQVTASTETTATIKFNKAIDAATLTANAQAYFTHTYNTATNKVQANGAGVVTNPSGDQQTFLVTFATPLAPGVSSVWFGYETNTTDLQKVMDGYGNILAPQVFSVTTTADTTAPVAESAKFVDSTTVEVTYSEKVNVGALTLGNYTLKDSTGKAISVTGAAFKANTNNTVVTLTTGTINGGDYTLAVKNVKDASVAQNVVAETTLTFGATDKVAPQIVDKDLADLAGAINVKQVATDKLKVEFNEAMNGDDLVNKANWKYNGGALATLDTITALDGNKAVEIKFASGTVVTGANKLELIRIRDAAGNYMADWLTSMTIDAKANVGIYKAEVIAPTQVKLTIQDTISGATVSDFKVSVNNGTTYVNPVGIAATVANGTTSIILTLADANKVVNTDLAGASAVLVKTVDATGADGVAAGAKNQYLTAVEFVATTASDKVGINSFTAVTGDNWTVNATTGAVTAGADGKLDTIVITLKEDLYVASVSEADFTVEGYTVTKAVVDNTVAGSTITLTVGQGTQADGDVTPKVTLTGSIEDALRNVSGTIPAVTAVDGI